MGGGARPEHRGARALSNGILIRLIRSAYPVGLSGGLSGMAYPGAYPERYPEAYPEAYPEGLSGGLSGW